MHTVYLFYVDMSIRHVSLIPAESQCSIEHSPIDKQRRLSKWGKMINIALTNGKVKRKICIMFTRCLHDAIPVDVPVDAIPVDVIPVDAIPVDVIPVDAIPVDAIPVDVKPVDKS